MKPPLYLNIKFRIEKIECSIDIKIQTIFLKVMFLVIFVLITLGLINIERKFFELINILSFL